MVDPDLDWKAAMGIIILDKWGKLNTYFCFYVSWNNEAMLALVATNMYILRLSKSTR